FLWVGQVQVQEDNRLPERMVDQRDEERLGCLRIGKGEGAAGSDIIRARQRRSIASAIVNRNKSAIAIGADYGDGGAHVSREVRVSERTELQLAGSEMAVHNCQRRGS